MPFAIRSILRNSALVISSSGLNSSASVLIAPRSASTFTYAPEKCPSISVKFVFPISFPPLSVEVPSSEESELFEELSSELESPVISSRKSRASCVSSSTTSSSVAPISVSSSSSLNDVTTGFVTTLDELEAPPPPPPPPPPLDLIVKSVTSRVVDAFPAGSVTTIVQFEWSPVERVLNVIVLFPEFAVVVELEQSPPYVIEPV